MFKKIKFLCFGICLTLAMFSLTAFAALSDIEGINGSNVISRWNDESIIKGYPDGCFYPDKTITRAEFARVISDLFVLESDAKEFADVSEDAWYYTYVQNASDYIACCEAGEDGLCDNLFQPDKAMSKKEALEILSKLTTVAEETVLSAEGELTRAEFVVMLDEILGGENGFYFMLAVMDAEVIEDNEILPLTVLASSSDMATFNSEGQVLLLSWHKYPDSYIPGEQFTCKYGEMWTFTDKEILSWYHKNNQGITDWELRFEQLLGLPATDNKTHVSAFWVDMDEIIRPAYVTDVAMQISPDALDGSQLGDYKDWFNSNAEYSYNTSAYPWTRLGYTYDWYKDDTEYGVSEFIILPNSVIDVEWTKSFDEFLNWMAEN